MTTEVGESVRVRRSYTTSLRDRPLLRALADVIDERTAIYVAVGGAVGSVVGAVITRYLTERRARMLQRGQYAS